MCGTVTSEDYFSIRYVPGQYKTQQMSDEAVDDCLADKVKLDKDDNFYENDPDTIFYVRILALHS